MGRLVEKVGDKGWFEFYGAQGLNYFFRKVFLIMSYLQLNRVKVYMKIFVVRVIGLMFVVI